MQNTEESSSLAKVSVEFLSHYISAAVFCMLYVHLCTSDEQVLCHYATKLSSYPNFYFRISIPTQKFISIKMQKIGSRILFLPLDGNFDSMPFPL